MKALKNLWVCFNMYNTSLSPLDEIKFQDWFLRKNKIQSVAPLESGRDYDFRGAYNAGLSPGIEGHWLDKFKKPNHPTFSIESQYATGLNKHKAGEWLNKLFIPPAKKDNVIVDEIRKLLGG